MSATSLAHWLRSISDDDLTRLLRARRDLATPPPADTSVLATRAGTTGSVARACDELDTCALAVLEALLLLDADTHPVTATDLHELIGVDPRPALRRVRAVALVWGGDGELSAVPAVREVLGPYPAGLGADLSSLEDTDLTAALDEVSDAERGLLTTLAAGPPVGTSKDAHSHVRLAEAETPVQGLLARGLLIQRDPHTVELPKQLGIALRGGSVFSESVLAEPEPETTPHAPATVDEVAAGEALELARHMEALLESWSAAPPAVLKAGGLGVREVRRISRELEIDHTRAILLAELALGADLVGPSNATEPEWLPTALADSWLGSPPAHRWAKLAHAWLELPRLPSLAYRTSGADSRHAAKGTGGTPPAPLSDQLHTPLAAAARRRVLDTLAELPEGAGITSNEDLVRLLAWRAPRKGGAARDDLVRSTLAEAAMLGCVALGAVTTPARALLETEEPEQHDEREHPHTADERQRRATAVMLESLPAPVDHVLVQADLTIVAPGPLEPGLAAEIAALADVETAGRATVYRASESSLRRALDSGKTAQELHDLLAHHSRTPVPQGLSYLIDDVARRHGYLRCGACSSFVRCDDDVLIAQVLSSSASAEFGLRQIAPTVLVSDRPLTELLEGLRSRGFIPAAEGPDGGVVDLQPGGRRAAGRARTARRPQRTYEALSSASSARIDEVVARIRAGDRAATTRRGEPVRNAGGTGETSTTLALLNNASEQRREVWIGLVDRHGTASQRIVTPTRIGGGVVEGADNEQYLLHRITSAAFVDT